MLILFRTFFFFLNEIALDKDDVQIHKVASLTRVDHQIMEALPGPALSCHILVVAALKSRS